MPIVQQVVSLIRQVGRRELAILAAVLVPAGLLAVFIGLASEVLEGETRSFDEAFLLALRDPADTADPIGPAWFETMMKDITALGSTTVLTLVTLGAAGFLLVARKQAPAVLILVTVAGGTLLSNLLKFGFARPRPDLVAHAVEVSTLSFPSGHAMLSAVTYLTLGAMLSEAERDLSRRTYILALAACLTVLIGSSRVYLGVHYPTDVLAGWVVGAAWAMVCLSLARLLGRRGRNGSGAPDRMSTSSRNLSEGG
jgi:undecaprenyl-diphosphatase